MGSKISIMNASISRISRKVISLVGLGNESSSGYATTTWDVDFNPSDILMFNNGPYSVGEFSKYGSTSWDVVTNIGGTSSPLSFSNVEENLGHIPRNQGENFIEPAVASHVDATPSLSQSILKKKISNFLGNHVESVEENAHDANPSLLPSLQSKKLSIFSEDPTQGQAQGLGESSHDAPPSLLPSLQSKKVSIFIEDPTQVVEENTPKSHLESEIIVTSRVEKIKKKMSVFFALTQSDSHQEGQLSSIDTLSEQDLPSFHGSEMNNDLSHSQLLQPLPLGKRKVPRTKKLGVTMQSQYQLHLLSNLHLIGITFFAVSGGPYGFEPTVAAGGPGLMLLGLLLFPILWAAPLAFMTAELSCMIPESGGHVLWVYRAFGPFWSFINSCFAFACSILDSAMYPVLFVEYISDLFYEGKHNLSYGWSIFLKLFIVVLVTIINLLGVDIVGLASILLGLMVLAPLAIMCLLGLGHLNFDWMDPGKNGSSVIEWQKFVTLLLWNTSGFDAIGTCAAEVRNPSQAYPHALKVSVALIVGVYAVPTIIGVSVRPNFSEWTEGTYMIVAKLIGGSFLKDWMGVSAACSALGLLLTHLCTNSRIVYGMALVEQVPPVFSKLHPKYSTPWVAILVTSLCTTLLTGFSFYSLVEADMLFYAFSTTLKFAALVQLRFTEPDAFRPYRIPLENYTLVACAIVPIGLCISMIWLSSERAHGILIVGATIAILCFIAKEIHNQYGSQAEEAMNNRLEQIQKNMNKMQQRIDRVIAEEFSAPLSNLGQAIYLSPYPSQVDVPKQEMVE